MGLLANIGMPMLLFAGPAFVLGFIPIVLIESWVMARMLGTRFREIVSYVAASNLTSTLVGIPIAWIVMLFIGPLFAFLAERIHSPSWSQVVLSPAWQPPDPNEPFWVVPVCELVLLVPFFFASVAIERQINLKAPFDEADLRRATWYANLASYALLAVFWITELWLHPQTWMYRTS